MDRRWSTVDYVPQASPQPENGAIGTQRSMGDFDLTSSLLQAQKADGGWSYQGSTSWTEPTALALLALASCSVLSSAYERGCQWLASQQRMDGGWPPNAQVPLSTAVTSHALLALSDLGPKASAHRGIDWMLRHIKPQLTLGERIGSWWQGRPSAENVMGGSPWFPGTAAWIAPTVMSVLCLADARCKQGRHDLTPIIAQGKQYLLSRRCQGGGWNHGGSRVYSETAPAYPEMTGLALLAFDESELPLVSNDLALAEGMLASPQSGEAQSWLRIALTKHGRSCAAYDANRFPCRTVRETSLRLLADAAKNSGHPFVVKTT